MNYDYAILLQCALFRGMEFVELENFLACLSTTERSYGKLEMILAAGAKVKSVGILLEGSAQITREDGDGNRAILSELVPSDLFGEAYAAVSSREVPITVIATGPCRVLWIPFHSIVSQCANACDIHQRLVENFIRLIAEKNIMMNEKMRLISCRTTRDKLLTYFKDYSEMVGRQTFQIPFSWTELADYLCVDRSAMSRELGRLRDQGIIAYHKNEIQWLTKWES